jgi:hypothetical protein
MRKMLTYNEFYFSSWRTIKQFGFEPDYKKPEDYIQKFCSRSIIVSDSLLSSWKDIADFVKENGTQNPKMNGLLHMS